MFCVNQIRIIFASAFSDGTLAQLVEQRTENPCVPGSIPGGTTRASIMRLFLFYAFINLLYLTLLNLN